MSLDRRHRLLRRDGGTKLRAEPLFAALPTVRTGRVVELSVFERLALNPGPVRTPWAIDNVVPKLLAAFGC
jgi:hypothetical protein